MQQKIESSTESLTETHPHMIIKLSKCLLSYVYYRDIRRGPCSWFESRQHEKHKVLFQNESNAHEVERYGNIKLKYNKNANSRTLNIVDVYYLLISIINVRLNPSSRGWSGNGIFSASFCIFMMFFGRIRIVLLKLFHISASCATKLSTLFVIYVIIKGRKNANC